MLALLRDLTPEVGEVKPTLLTKYVRRLACEGVVNQPCLSIGNLYTAESMGSYSKLPGSR